MPVQRKTIFLGNSEMIPGQTWIPQNTPNTEGSTEGVTGDFMDVEGERYYRISEYHRMPDFLMSIISDSDHYMFISSNGSLSAGRKDRDHALFPYYTDDKIHDYRGITGSRSWFLVTRSGKTYLWEPFTSSSERIYRIRRNLYKSIYANSLIFEELNLDLEVGYRYRWSNSAKYGFIRSSRITNLGTRTVEIDLLDGLGNILPSGADATFQNEFSNLLDAYKKSELVEETTLGLYLLSAIPVDRAEPSEALKANTVWSTGMGSDCRILLSDNQVQRFVEGAAVETEVDIRATRGAYYLHSSIQLNANASADWMMVSNLDQDSSQVSDLTRFLQEGKKAEETIIKDQRDGTMNLKRIVGSADGFQRSNEEIPCIRHFSNTLYNVMRGGVFHNHYHLERSDFRLFIQQTSRGVFNTHENWIDGLPESLVLQDLVRKVRELGDPDMERIAHEYLPLTFSRRHGDPSRPWNRFAIENRNPDGSTRLYYEGNWRDIFQNWEALALSYPGFLESMISKFLNATSADGYNPYRITREGIDWEVPDPNEPWAFIGYWGDHQIIYLQKFFEQAKSYHPGLLEELLQQELFVYAHIPYRIKSFGQIVENPKDTIEFDFELDRELRERMTREGADGCLLRDTNDNLCRANLAEKILVTLLAKLSNFIPGAGIWMNTQRPEWNDANNALVGNGTSMVTLYYLRRFLQFWHSVLAEAANKEIPISEEIHTLFRQMGEIFSEHRSGVKEGFSDNRRWHLTRQLGEAGARYRETVYSRSLSGKKNQMMLADLGDFMELVLPYLDQSIEWNRREDGLYHAYNLVSFHKEGISIRTLYEMLEGQVAVLSSGYLDPEESLSVLDSLKASRLFREDQYSYLLYPDRQLPRFTEKNRIPKNRLNDSALLRKLAENDDRSIVLTDRSGNGFFNGNLRNEFELERELEKLDNSTYRALAEKEKGLILEIYEELFDHQSFTGRSGTFFGYEGLGSIYWHMVSKLLLAVGECHQKASEAEANAELMGRIKEHYYEIKAGIGLYKSPKLYGAFPTDAYSHTPAGSGVKQPAMTGQVKEDVLSRMMEMGVRIKDGKIMIDLSLLNRDELLEEKSFLEYIDLKGQARRLDLDPGQLAFTFCQVPLVCRRKEREQVVVRFHNGDRMTHHGHTIDRETSNRVFRRTGQVESITYESPFL